MSKTAVGIPGAKQIDIHLHTEIWSRTHPLGRMAQGFRQTRRHTFVLLSTVPNSPMSQRLLHNYSQINLSKFMLKEISLDETDNLTSHSRGEE